MATVMEIVMEIVMGIVTEIATEIVIIVMEIIVISQMATFEYRFSVVHAFCALYTYNWELCIVVTNFHL